MERCAFPLTVEDVPESPFYQIEVGGREGPSCTFDAEDQFDWTVDLILGEQPASPR